MAGVASIVIMVSMLRVGGGAGVGVGEGGAGGAVSVGVVGCCRCRPGGVLTAEAGPRHSWRLFPLASLAGVLALAPFVSSLPMVSHRVVSPSLSLRVAVGEVALSLVPSVMPVVRSLRALLWFTASLMLLMLLVVGVGLCVGCQWPVFGVGRWLVPVALSGRVCSRWRGLLVMLLVRVVPAVVWVPLVTAWWMAPCGWYDGGGVVVDGSGRVSSPPLAGDRWFAGSPAVVALVSSGGRGCRWRR